MSKIVLATFGSLGDLHPFIALGLELRKRGHEVCFATLEFYREKIGLLGFDFACVRPNVTPEGNEQLARDLMDAGKGTERILREILFPVLRESYEDLQIATADADLLISGEVVFAAPILAEKTGLKWISTSLAPGSFFSAYDPFVPPIADWFENLRFLGAGFHKATNFLVKQKLWSWSEPVREFRRELGLPYKNIEPILTHKFSSLLHLAMFSEAFGAPQKDWHQPTVQTGFCFYDGNRDEGKMPEGLREFLAAGDAPIVFTLGSAAVWVADNFYEESAKAAQILHKRAVLLIGKNEPPRNLPETIKAFEYAPYGEIFDKAACVVHQAGIGTTSQVLRAGVPHLIMPFSHDQFDNAARCVRLGVARKISREKYNAQTAAQELTKIFADLSYKAAAHKAKAIIEKENGAITACDAIEKILHR